MFTEVYIGSISGISTNHNGNAVFVIGSIYDMATFNYHYGMYSADAGTGSSYTALTNLQNVAGCIAQSLDSTGTILMCSYFNYGSMYIAVSTDSGALFTDNLAYSGSDYSPNSASFAASTNIGDSISYMVPYTTYYASTIGALVGLDEIVGFLVG